MEIDLFDFIGGYMPLREEEKKAILDLNIFRSYDKGSILLNEGDIPHLAYFVIKGCLRTYLIVEGEEKTTEFYTEMQGVTPGGINTKTPSTHYVECVEDSIITVSDPRLEKEIFEKFPRFETLCRIMSEELLAKSQVAFDDFRTSSPEQRYLNLVRTRPDLVQRVPQYQLASYLGIKPQSLSRIRKRLASQKPK
ncbi:MAG TPA: Crp/Fnr family transcriptional regulator [Chryseosolibacter sp.]